MKIETAGEQRYFELIQERSKQVRTAMIVWASLLAAALIAFTANPKVGFILAAAGIVLAAVNIKARKELNGILDKLPDKQEFFCQLTDPETVEIPEYGLVITKDYVFKYREDPAVYCFSEIEKIEVGIQGTIKKVLFLTGKDEVRHAVAECAGDGGDSTGFDEGYRVLNRNLRDKGEGL